MGKPTRPPDGDVYVRWIEDRLEALNITQRALAKHLGWAPSAVSRLLSGGRQLKAAEIRLAAVLLGPPPGASGVDPTQLPTHAEVPVVGRVTMAQWSPQVLQPQGTATLVVPTHRFRAQDQVVHEIDASMRGSPELGNNTHIASVLAATHRPMPAVGDLFVIRRENAAPFSPTGKLVNEHVYRAELRGSGICLVAFDGAEMPLEEIPETARWIISTVRDLVA